MAATNPPSFLQASSYGALAFRRPLTSLIGATGVVGATDLKVTAHTPANLSVTVASGQVWIPGNVVTNQGDYYGLNNATVNLSIAAASTTTPRIDLVCATVKDAFYAGSTNDWVIEVITGTPAASPAAPSLPSNSVPLAHVAVAASATTITNADITTERPRSGVHSVIVGTSAGAPSSGSYATGTGYMDSNDVLWVCTVGGTPGTWVPLAPTGSTFVPGILDTASSTFVSLGPSVTVQTGGRVLVTVTAYSYNSTSGDGGALGFAVSGASAISANTTQALTFYGTSPLSFSGSWVIAVTPGSNTFNLEGRAFSGTQYFWRRQIIVGPAA